MRNTLIVMGSLLALSWPGAAQNIFHKAPPELEDALRERVSQFYSLYQQAKFRQAEDIVAEESRDLYYGMSKVPIRGFQVESIEWSKDFQSAKVLVSCRYVTPRTASAEIYVPVTGNWKLRDGKWFLLIEKRETSPWGAMKFDDPNGAKPESFQRPTIETITTESFRIDQKRLVFPRQATGVITRGANITNNMPGTLYLEVEPSKLPGVVLRLPSSQIPPKGTVRFEVDYNAGVGKLTGVHEVRLLAQPIGQPINIQLQFE